MANVVVFLGPTGAGKSDQARRLAEAKGWTRVSSGDLLRTSGDAALVAGVKSGKLAPSAAILELVGGKLDTLSSDQDIVLDGFPRLLEEAEWLDGKLKSIGRKVNLVIEVFVPQAVAESRIAGRNRADDSPDTVARKWSWYMDKTAKVLEHYGSIAHHIDGTGTPEEVYSRVEDAL